MRPGIQLYFLASPKRSCYLRRAKRQRPHGRRSKEIPAQGRRQAERRRAAPGDGKPAFAGKPRADGKKPYVKRAPEAAAGRRAAEARLQARRQAERRGRANASAGASKPFRKGRRRRERGERKPFVRREGGEERKPFVKRADGDRKPYVRREDGGAAGERPKRDFERQERSGQGGRSASSSATTARGTTIGDLSDRERPAADGGAPRSREGVRSFGTQEP